MAITATTKATSTDTSQLSAYDSPLFTPSSGTILVVAVANVDSATDDLPTLSDSLGEISGADWHQIRQQNLASTDIYNLTVFWGKTTSGTGRFVTATFPNAQTGCIIHVLELSGTIHLTNPVAQSNGYDTSGATTPNVSLSSAPAATSLVYAATQIRRNPANWTEEAGWTEQMDTGHGTPANGATVHTKTNDQTFTATGTNGAHSAIIIEFQTSSNVVTVNQVSETDSVFSLITGRTYTFNGGTAGSAVTTSDTGSGDPFDLVSLGAGTGTVLYNSAAAVSGNLGGRFNGGTNDTAYVRWNVDEQTESYVRFYMQSPTAIPTVSRQIYRIRTSSSALKAAVRFNTQGNIVLVDAASTAQYTSSKAFVAGERFRVEVHVVHHATAGHMEARLFWGANLHGSTASETIGNLTDSLNTTATGTGVDWLELGWTQAVTNEVLDFDEIKWQTNTWVGPVSAGTIRAVAQVTETDAVQSLVVTPVTPTGYTWDTGMLFGGGGINTITADPTGNGRWAAGGDNNGPKWSIDDGVSWKQGFDGFDESNSGQELQSISIQWSLNPATPNRVWLACKGGWRMSDDGGKSWALKSTQPSYSHQGDRPRVVGHIIADTGGNLVYSGAINGVVWRYNVSANSMTNIATLPDPVTGLICDPTDNTVLIATTRGGVYQIEGADSGTRTVRNYTGTNAPARAEEVVAVNEGGTIMLYVAAYTAGVRRVARGTIGGGGNITTAWSGNLGPSQGNQINAIDAYRSGSTTRIAIGDAQPIAVSNGFGQIWYSTNGQAASPTWTCLSGDDANSQFTNEMGGAGGLPWWGYGIRANSTPKEKSANRWIDNHGSPEQVLFHPTDRTKIYAGGQQGIYFFDLTAQHAYPYMYGLHCGVETYCSIDPNDDDNIYVTNSDHIGHHTRIGGRNGDWRKNENGNPDLNGTTAFLPAAPDYGVVPAHWWTGYGERFWPSALSDVFWHDDPSDGTPWQSMGFGADLGQGFRVVGIAVRRIAGKIVVLAAAQPKQVNGNPQGGGIAKATWNPGTPPTGGVWEWKNQTAFTNCTSDSRAVSMYWGTDTVAYAYDPQTGLWRTRDAGETWSIIWDDCHVGSGQERQGYFKVDPDNGGTLYCSFGNAAPVASEGVWKITGATAAGNIRLNGVNGSISKVEIKKPDNSSFSLPSDIGVAPGGLVSFIEMNANGQKTECAVYISRDDGNTLTDVTDNYFRRSIRKVFSSAMDSQGKIYVTMNGPGIVVGTPGQTNKVVTLAQVTETDSVQPVSNPNRIIAVTQVSETDTAQAVGHPLVRLVAEVTESDSVQTLAHRKAVPIVQAVELDEGIGVANAGSFAVRILQVTGRLTPRATTGRLNANAISGRLSSFTATGRLDATRSAVGVLTPRTGGGSLRALSTTGVLRDVATTANFTIKRAEDVTITFTLNGTDGTTPQNISGWTLAFRAGSSQYGNATITKTPTITNAAQGIFTVALASTDTSALTQDGADTTYFYDIRRTDSGSRTELFEGTLTVQDTFTNG